MKKRQWLWVILTVAVGIGLMTLFGGGESPALPASPTRVTISLNEPYGGETIVERTISDPEAISALVESLSAAKSGRDHKCGSIGTICFLSPVGVTVLSVLPGHDPAQYEFRLGGDLFKMKRESYIDCLIAAGISREDIRLDGHPDR